MAENKGVIAVLITAFLLIILGSSLITIISGNTNEVTSPTQIVDESLSISTLRYGAKGQINNSNNVTLTNQGLADAGGWVDDSIIIALSNGTLLGSNNYTVDYTAQKITF